jgi:hypothetical protein
MSLLDSIVGRSFRDEKAGRVVVFTGDRRNRGYVVKSESEELKIRSFLKMFYFAHFSILTLGMLVANAWSTFFVNIRAFRPPAAHLLRSEGIYLGIYFLVVGLPYFLLWRSYKKALVSFVSAQDEVLVSGKSTGRQTWIVVAALTALGLATLMLFYAVRAK